MGDIETCLYRHFDDAGALLYVGVSNDSLRRTRDHNRNAPWMRQIAEIKIKWYPSLNAALNAEAAAIKAEKPKFNVTHNRGTQLVNLRPAFRTTAARMAHNYSNASSRLKEREPVMDDTDTSHLLAMANIEKATWMTDREKVMCKAMLNRTAAEKLEKQNKLKELPVTSI